MLCHVIVGMHLCFQPLWWHGVHINPCLTGASLCKTNCCLKGFLQYQPCKTMAKMAVNTGVVDPTAWLNEMGIYLSDKLPSTMVKQKMVASRHTFHSCFFDFSGLTGVMPDTETT